METRAEVLLLVLALLFGFICPVYGAQGEEHIFILSDWQHLSSSSQNLNIDEVRSYTNWVPVNSISEVINEHEGEAVWLRTTLPDHNIPDPAILLSQVDYSVRVYLNGNLIYSLGKDSEGANYLGRIITVVPLRELNEKNDLILRLYTGNYWAKRQIVYGSASDIFKSVLFFDLNNLIFAVVFIVTGLLALIPMFVFPHKQLLAALLVFLVSLGLLILSNSSFVQLVFNAPRFFYHLYYISIACSGIGGFLIIRSMVAPIYKKTLNVLIAVHTAFLLFCLILLNNTNIRFVEIVPYYFILIAGTIIPGLTALYRGRKQSSYEIKILAGGIAVYCLFVIIEFILLFTYSYDNTYGYSIKVLNYGVLAVIISIIWVLIDENRKSVKQLEKIHELELENIRQENEARHYFAASLMESQESERNRIAMELHDSIGQKLLLLKNQLLYKLKTSENHSTKFLNDISSLTGELINEIRSIIYNLRPQHLDQLGLKTAIETMIEKVSETSGVTFRSSIDDINGLLGKHEEINLYRIIQESLNNIVRHSKADAALVEILRVGDMLQVKIVDNGIGFDPAKTTSYKSFGLTGIRERGRMLGAEIEIESQPGKGTVINLKYLIRQKESEREHEPYNSTNS